MARLTPLHFVPAMLAAATHAGEMTVGHAFSAIVLPGSGCVSLEHGVKALAGLPLVEIAPHGSRVSRGDLLIRLDAGPLEIHLLEIRHSLDAATLAFSESEQELKHLKETAAHRLDSLRRAAENARDEHASYNRTRRMAAEQSAVRSLRIAEEILASQRQELSRLAKWQDAGERAGEPGETMLEGQEDEVAAAEFSLRMEMLNHRRALEVLLPREAQTLADTARDTAANFLKAEAEIPVTIELKKLELDALEADIRRAKETLAELEAAHASLESKAPADGWFYHTPEVLAVGTTVPAGVPFATFVPATAALDLVAFVDESAARSLAPDLAATVIPAGREDLEIPAKLVRVGSVAEPGGTCRLDFSVVWPDGFSPAPGTVAQVRLVSREPPAATVLP